MKTKETIGNNRFE